MYTSTLCLILVSFGSFYISHRYVWLSASSPSARLNFYSCSKPVVFALVISIMIWSWTSSTGLTWVLHMDAAYTAYVSGHENTCSCFLTLYGRTISQNWWMDKWLTMLKKRLAVGRHIQLPPPSDRVPP